MRKNKIHLKSDERILGNGDFINHILSASDEAFERRYALKGRGWMWISLPCARFTDFGYAGVADVWLPGSYKRLVAARSLICFLAVRGPGESMASLARRFNISGVAVSKSVKRGAGIIELRRI